MRFPGATLLAITLLMAAAWAKGPKTHTVTVGDAHVEKWLGGSDASQPQTMSVRPLYVDGQRKRWVTGAPHVVTDHSFVVLQAERVNDAMPGERAPHFVWRTSDWLLVERSTGHISAIKLDGYDPKLSGLSWFRDYAAYCPIVKDSKSREETIFAEAVQLGSRRPAARQRIGVWPLPATVESSANSEEAADGRPKLPVEKSGTVHPAACEQIEWQRDPLRVSILPRAGMVPIVLDLAP